MFKTFKTTGLFFLWLSLLVLLLDVLTKGWAQAYLEPYTAVPIFPGFNLTLAYNTGAAFSLLATASFGPNLLFSGIALVVSLLILQWLYCSPRHARLFNFGLALILGGAVGNLWDRLRYHQVTDFLDFYLRSWHWPVFNIADAAVSTGALLVIWSCLRKGG
jgi:signal peptidase II